jgi:CHAD domain-containing protein
MTTFQGRTRPVSKTLPLKSGAIRISHPRAAEHLLLHALGTRWKIFLGKFGRCNRRCSEPAVHGLRVATRRLIVAIDLLARVSPWPQAGRARQQLKRLLESMGPLRDTQVQILLLRELRSEFPELGPLSTIMLLQEQRNLKRIAVRMERVQITVLRLIINAGIADLKRLMRRSPLRPVLGVALRGALATSYLRIIQLRQQLDRFNPASIHHMRIAFKKFRYATEVLRPDMEARFHDEMNALQTMMGDIHDLEVLRSSVKRFAVRSRSLKKPTAVRNPVRGSGRQAKPSARKPPSIDLIKIDRRLQRRYATLVRRFIESANEIYRFQLFEA